LFPLLTAPLLAQSAADLEIFEKKIRPIFAAKCYACHAGKTPMAGIDFSSSAGFEAVIDGRLVQAVGYEAKIKMPPAGKLPDNEIADIRAWIAMGAPRPKQSAATPHPSAVAEGRKYWAFQPVKDYPPPRVKNESWARSPIDRFILAKLEEKGIRPAPPASKLTLLRRVTYDLIGLPPTPKEIADFLADRSQDAYAKVVDRLLASPQYGENWGRHWLDVARYADSTGMDEDHVYPYAWRYRDYVVKAFNNDLPYDRFVTEQVAGDLLQPANPVATGFLALGPKPLAQQDRIKMIYDVVDEQIDTVSKAFMGLTVACARCHDHKFDPILTKDYYSLASIFASTENFRNLGRPGAVSYIYFAPLDPAAFGIYQAHRWRMYAKQLEMEEALAEDWTREYALLRPRIAEFLTAAWKAERAGKSDEKWARWLHAASDKARQGYLKKLFDATDDTIAQVARESQEAYLKSATRYDTQLDSWRKRMATEILEDRDLPARPKPNAEANAFFAAVTFDGGPLELTDSPRVAELRREWKQLEATLPPEPPMASAVRDGALVEQHVFLHGDNNSPGEPVARQFPVVLAGESQKPITSGSGRLELAKWLTSPDHPLTARVMVNRIWQGHFGEALMRTPNNWGKTGETPTHPELLDFLAKRFVESGWSIKAVHRMILLSSAYQMDSRAAKEARDADPANRLYARFNRVRMSVEQIRDSFLAIGGNLDLAIGGSLLAGAPMQARRQRVDPDELGRRTLYIPVRRGSIPTVLATFDYGDATTSGEGRPRTNVAPQALFVLNSQFVQRQAGGLAKRLLDDVGLTDKQRVEQAYLTVLTRRPEAEEVDGALTYIGDLEKRIGKAQAHQTAWQSFCHVLLSTNEFLYLN
jgi:hypothetical protein